MHLVSDNDHTSTKSWSQDKIRNCDESEKSCCWYAHRKVNRESVRMPACPRRVSPVSNDFLDHSSKNPFYISDRPSQDQTLWTIQIRAFVFGVYNTSSNNNTYQLYKEMRTRRRPNIRVSTQLLCFTVKVF